MPHKVRPSPSGQKQTADFIAGTQRPKTDRRFHRWHPAVKNRPPFSLPVTQRPKTDRRFHRWHPAAKNRPPISSPVTQRSKTDHRFHRWHPAVKNRPPFSSLALSGQKQTAVFIAGTQRPKTDHRFHHFWPSGQKRGAFFTTFGPAVKNRPPIAPPLGVKTGV